jgi:hypothetical protein
MLYQISKTKMSILIIKTNNNSNEDFNIQINKSNNRKESKNDDFWHVLLCLYLDKVTAAYRNIL